MIIQPKVKDYICTTAHPVGCAENVKRQIQYIKEKGTTSGPKKVLVIGCSTGYGLASRIAATYACQADTLGIMFERPSNGRRTATPGYYNTKAFEKQAASDGYYAKTINGDAFSKEIKDQTIEIIKQDLGKVDMVIYSLAAPKRTAPDGITYTSILKTVGEDFQNKSLNLGTNEIVTASVSSANQEEIDATVKVMGGEDWMDWITALSEAGVLADNTVTLAYSYIGPKLTYPIYFKGTIGAAKQHLYATSDAINKAFGDKGITAYVSINKALVTQASAAIPVVPLYMTVLYQVMKEQGLHEGCIEQMSRLFHEKLSGDTVSVDENGYIRLDDYEMKPEIQEEVEKRWAKIDTSNVKELADIDGYWDDFYQMFGFHFDNVDYDADVEI